MSPELQQSLTLAIVALAAGAMAYRLLWPWFGTKTDADCSAGCGSCPANKDAARTELGQPLVQIQMSVKKQSVE